MYWYIIFCHANSILSADSIKKCQQKIHIFCALTPRPCPVSRKPKLFFFIFCFFFFFFFFLKWDIFRILWFYNSPFIIILLLSKSQDCVVLSKSCFPFRDSRFSKVNWMRVYYPVQYIRPIMDTNKLWIQGHQLKNITDHQLKRSNSQWLARVLSERFHIDLLVLNCKRFVVVVWSKKSYSECKNSLQGEKLSTLLYSLLCTDSCCWTYWPKHLDIVCLSEK